jgi:hypothetical protein
MQQPADQLRQQLERADQLPLVRSDIRKSKALGWLMEHVEIVDSDGNPIDRDDLQPDFADLEQSNSSVEDAAEDDADADSEAGEETVEDAE